MSSPSIDIGDYKPCTMTPADFGAAVAIVVPAHLHKHVCDFHKNDNAERKARFEMQLVGVSNNFKAHRAENVELKKKLEDNAMLKRYFREAMPYITAQRAALYAYHTTNPAPAGASSTMTVDEASAAFKTGSAAQRENAMRSCAQQLESTSQFLFGTKFEAVGEENHKTLVENVVMKNLLEEYEKQK